MLRYIKVNNVWIDTLREQKENYRIYLVIDKMVYCINEDDSEVLCGRLQEEKNEL